MGSRNAGAARRARRACARAEADRRARSGAPAGALRARQHRLRALPDESAARAGSRGRSSNAAATAPPSGAHTGTARGVVQRYFRKGEIRRFWRDYWPEVGAFLLAVAVVAVIV